MPHTLLLADDSVTIQRVIELTFADEDVKVVAVSDGDQAIARLDAQPPDIVLADVGMPGKNGYEVAQYIKQSPRLSHIPVVLLTGAFEPVDQARAAQAGCDGVLAKPFEPQLVIGRVRELLGHGKATAPAAAAHPLDAALAPPPAPAAPWTAPVADAPLPAPPTPPTARVPTSDLTNYFDRLDQAFAHLSQQAAADPAPAIVAPPPEAPAPSPAPVAPPAAPADIDWFGAPAATPEPPIDIPLSYASSQSAFDAAPTSAFDAVPAPAFDAVPAAAEATRSSEPWPVAHAVTETPAAPEPPAAPETPVRALPDKPIALPPLADAFAALLAAERGDTPSNVAWPSTAPAPAAPAPPPPSIDAIADQVTARVLESIAPRVDNSVRDAVADLVSQLAERLIREEIERIKASIK